MLARGMMGALRARAAAGATTPARWLKILACDPVDAVCGEIFRDRGHKLVEKKMNREELLACIAQYDGLVVRSGVRVTEDIIKAGTKLKIIGRAGAGVDNIDTVAATRRGIVVMNTPGGNTSAAAELTMSLLMNTARAIPAACAQLKGGVWDRKTWANGVELKGKTIGVVGLGMIGTEVARRCQALDMATIGFDPLVTDDKAAAAGVRKVSLETLFETADIITLHTPFNEATKNLICKATLAKCKPGVIIINAARGGIVNEADLLEALTSGKVAGAGIDVFEQEPPTSPASRALIAHPRVVCTPHLGASTEEAQKKVAREIAVQMSDAFAHTGFVGVVNAAHLGLAHKPALEPFVRLSNALGTIQGQMWQGAARGATVQVEVEGPLFTTAGASSSTGAGAASAAAAAAAKAASGASASTAAAAAAAAAAAPGVLDLIKAALLKGILPALPGSDVDADAVNLVNAPLLADAAAVRVAMKYHPVASGPYTNAVRVTVVSSSGSQSVTGSVIEGAPRVVQVDHWQSFPSFAPEGHVLLFNNLDKPGAVGRVTSLLADNNINIASLSVARQYPGSPALSVVISDQRVPAEVKAKVEALDGISNVRTVSFDGAASGGAGAAVAGGATGVAGVGGAAASA